MSDERKETQLREHKIEIQQLQDELDSQKNETCVNETKYSQKLKELQNIIDGNESKIEMLV